MNLIQPEWERLLGRQTTAISPAAVAEAVAGRRVLITGGGGSIGAALAHAIAPDAPVLLLDSSEQALYKVDRALRELGASYEIVLGSAGDPLLLASLFRLHQPQIIFHAAAYKHVPLLEENPFAAIANNVLATSNLLKAARGCDQFVLVSTDKAVDPHSIMGASKRIAELLLLAPGAGPAQRTAVRLGNVLGSDGSVVPLFLEQMARGLPLTVAHPDVRRFFMTMDEAVTALVGALKPHPGCVLVPELHAPLRIAQLAQRLLDEAGRGPQAAIVFTALRPGDKMEEALLGSGESWMANGTGELRAVVSPFVAMPVLETALTDLDRAVAERDLILLLKIVQQLVPEYQAGSVLRATSRIPEAGE